jgi:hypothetical protein
LFFINMSEFVCWFSHGIWAYLPAQSGSYVKFGFSLNQYLCG